MSRFLSLILLAVMLWSTTDSWAGSTTKGRPGKAVPHDAVGRTSHSSGSLDNQGGPDGFGYRYVDNQSGDSVQFTWFELRGDGSATWIDFTDNSDDNVETVTLPFAFPFYGGMYTSVTISTNGNLQLSGADDYYSNDCLPSQEIGAPMVCVFWDDLHLDNGGYNPGGAQTVGYRFTPQYAIIEWDSVGRIDNTDGGSYKFQAILYPTGHIKLQYDQITWGSTMQSQTIGVQAGSAGPALQYTCDAAGPQPLSGLAVLFYQTGTGSIAGVVQNEAGDPLYQAVVRIDELGVTTVADGGGAYVFPMVAPGTYSLTASRASYTDGHASDVVVVENQQTTQNFSLPWAGTYTYISYDVPRNIEDNATVTSVLVVDTSMIVGDLDVQVNIQHTYASDLQVNLQSPGGETISLIYERGGSGENFTNTILDDEAQFSISQGTSPFTGSFRPEEPLSVLDGADVQGTWTLSITDVATLDEGQLLGWEIHVGAPLAAEPEAPMALPDFALLGNYPNPFNAATEICYSLPQQSVVKLVVYNVLGQEVRTLVHDLQPAGLHRTLWDGLDPAGREAASGLYLMRLTAGGRSSTGKLLLAR